MPITFDPTRGDLVASTEERRMVEELLREAGFAPDARKMELLHSFGAAITEPIKKFADYTEAFGDIFLSSPTEWNDPNAYPIEEYDVIARQTSPDAQFNPNRVGLSWGTISLVRFDSSFEVHDYDLQRATFDLVGQKTRIAGMELARKRDAYVRALLDTAASSVTGHVSSVTGGAMTKASVDAILDSAAKIGYEITRVFVNVADINKMRGWTSDVFGVSPANQELLRRSYLGDYGGAQWIRTRAIPPYAAGSQQGAVYFLVDPEFLGYRRVLSEMATDVERMPRKKLTAYLFEQMLGWAIVNPYGVWKLLITD
jgi:hypothetical protein